jgi:hypothetical protein
LSLRQLSLSYQISSSLLLHHLNITMSDLAFDEFFESLAPAVQVSNADEPGFSEEEADSLDICARKNLDTVFSIISPQVVRKVDINYIYLRQRSTIITAVPVDLQLAWLFENFPQVCKRPSPCFVTPKRSY